jgi:hypothetical protein
VRPACSCQQQRTCTAIQHCDLHALN